MSRRGEIAAPARAVSGAMPRGLRPQEFSHRLRMQLTERTTGRALGGLQRPSYLSGEKVIPECAWWEPVGALCN